MSGGDTPKRCLLRRALPYKAEEGRSSGFETSRRSHLEERPGRLRRWEESCGDPGLGGDKREQPVV